jgi:hypothetical protein
MSSHTYNIRSPLFTKVQKKNLSYLLQAFRRPSHWAYGGMKKCEGTSPFQKKIQGIAEKSLLERRRRHVPNGTMEWNFVSTLVFCRGGHWRMMIVEKGCQIHGRKGKLLEARYSQLK